jgi:hypothetical protein
MTMTRGYLQSLTELSGRCEQRLASILVGLITTPGLARLRDNPLTEPSVLQLHRPDPVYRWLTAQALSC